MGCTQSLTPEEKQAKDRAKEIDSVLKAESNPKTRTFKVLLLGAGDSGKSTFVKQMILIHKELLSELDVKRTSDVIKISLIKSIKLLASQANTEKLSKSAQKSQNWILEVHDETDPLWKDHVVQLWKDPEIQDIFSKRISLGLQLETNIKHFLDSADRILATDFVPTKEDILAARVITTGIIEQLFNLPKENLSIKMVDVGGQRSERRKWMNQFDKVDLVIYFSAVDGYALKMHESEGNRLEDDLRLFSSLMLLVPQKKAWVFCQNKVDVFPGLLKQYPLSKYFPEIPADKGTDPDYCLNFLEAQFRQRWDGPKDNLKFFQTCGLDTNQMAIVWGSIKADLTKTIINNYV